MALELAEVAGGLPMAVSFAMAGGIAAIRNGRRRGSLNEAMHELRRPLQALALLLPVDSPQAEAAESSLRMAAAAVERLDRQINGGSPTRGTALMPLRPLVETAVERWRGRAALVGGSLSLRWSGGEPELQLDRVELAQAVDNLISNALLHGGGEVLLDVREVGGVLRLSVLDSGDSRTVLSDRSRPGLWDRLAGRNRHGHGLRIVRRVAANHGGSFRLRRIPGGSEARLELPLAGGAR